MDVYEHYARTSVTCIDMYLQSSYVQKIKYDKKFKIQKVHIYVGIEFISAIQKVRKQGIRCWDEKNIFV